MNIVPFIPAHLDGLEVNEYVSFVQPDFANPQYGDFLSQGVCHSAIKDGEVIGCAGFIPMGVNRWHAWALFSNKTRHHMTQITRFARELVYNLNVPRIETNIREDFEQAKKFIELLDFVRETPLPMKNYGDDGMSYYLYSRCL